MQHDPIRLRARRRARRRQPYPIRAALIAGGALLVLLITCSAPRPRALLPAAPAALNLPAPGAGVGAASAPTDLAATALPELPTVTPGPTAPPTPATTPTPFPGSAPDAPPLDALGQSLDAYLSGLAAAGQFQGAVLVARGDRVIIAKGYGEADLDVPNTSRTRIRLASLTKQFTAAAIMLLQSQGRLSVDDRICGYLDDCPEAWQPITIRQLLNHTSGLVDYTDFLGFVQTEMNPTTPQELVARFRDQPLAFAPGTLYDYCNSGYVLLGLIVERASGMSYDAFLEQAFFAPLGLGDTGYDTSRGTYAPDGAQGFTTPGLKTGFLDASTLYAAGGLYSTVEDLYRWDQALYGDFPLPHAQVEAMFVPAHRGYGFGWRITEAFGTRKLNHPGNITGFATYFARYPEARVTVIVLANMEYAAAETIGDQLAAVVFASP